VHQLGQPSSYKSLILKERLVSRYAFDTMVAAARAAGELIRLHAALAASAGITRGCG